MTSDNSKAAVTLAGSRSCIYSLSNSQLVSPGLVWILPEADPQIGIQVPAACLGGEGNTWRGV